MKIAIVHDSVFGNTGEIARTMYESILSKEDVSFFNIKENRKINLNEMDLLIVGSPTRGFRPTPEITEFIKDLAPSELHGIKMAAFDTRLSIPDLHSPFVKFIVKNGGYAANTIANHLGKKGCQLIVSPEGFLVTGEKGPLKKGELERASSWINGIVYKCK